MGADSGPDGDGSERRPAETGTGLDERPVRTPVGRRRPYEPPRLVACGPVTKLLVETSGKPRGVGELVEQAFQ